MGYDLTRFIGQIDEELQCSICLLVLENPIQTLCEHSFCNNCIQIWLSKNLICPADGLPLTTADLKAPTRLLRNLLGKLNIKCDYHDIGCLEIIRLDNLQSHCTACVYNPETEVTCDKGCSMKISRLEYRMNDCFEHFRNRVSCLQAEISKLKDDAQFQAIVIENFKDLVSQLRSQMGTLDGKVSKQQISQLKDSRNTYQNQQNQMMHDVIKKSEECVLQ